MCNVGKKGPYAICEKQMSRWACASVQSEMDILCLSTYTTVSTDYVRGQWRPYWQANQGRCCLQVVYKGPFCLLPSYGIKKLMGKAYSHILILAHSSFQIYATLYIYLNWLFVLRFDSPVNSIGSCRAQPVYLTTLFLGRLSPLGS